MPETICDVNSVKTAERIDSMPEAHSLRFLVKTHSAAHETLITQYISMKLMI